MLCDADEVAYIAAKCCANAEAISVGFEKLCDAASITLG
jgi:hypothetical protein